jgi:hypothetical protein
MTQRNSPQRGISVPTPLKRRERYINDLSTKLRHFARTSSRLRQGLNSMKLIEIRITSAVRRKRNILGCFQLRIRN